MIRPRRTFQERRVQSAATWDRLKSGNRVRSWVRVLTVVGAVGLIALIWTSKPTLKTIQADLIEGAREVVQPLGNHGAQQGSNDQFNFVLGAEAPITGDDTNGPNEPAQPQHEDEEERGDEPGSLGEQDHEQEQEQEEEEEENENDHQVERPADEDQQPQLTAEAEPERPDQEEDENQGSAVEDGVQESQPVISTDGVVGNAEIGGLYDGKDVTLYQQITLPEQPILQHYDSTQNYWPLHAILRERGWSYATMALPSRVTMWISRGSVPPRLKQGYQMLNSMGVSGCIGGAKSLQLECRRRLARLNGCEYDILKIQPPQYNMLNLDDCRRFFADAEKPERMNKVYLSKPTYTFHGAGIRVHQGATGSLKTEFGACKTPKNTILMDYVSNPATMMGGYKFDFRTYLLVASLKPQLVFYHDGFVRKSDKQYDVHSKDLNVHITNKVTQSKEEHFFNFTMLGKELHRELGLPADHLDTYVRPRAKAVTRFLFQTTLVQPQPPRHVPGRFHLFGIDWLLDAKGKLHLLEGNGYPLVTHYPGIGLTPRIWEEMTDLILAIHTKPQTLPKQMTVKDGYAFGGWKLVFNELEELMDKAKGHPYSSCEAFADS